MADDTGGCFKGDKIDLTSLRTPEQQEMMKALGQALGPMLGQGATPYGGQINAPYDPAMLSAMNMMMQVGGQGPYQPFNFPTMAPQGGGSGGGPGGPGGTDTPWTPFTERDPPHSGPDVEDQRERAQHVWRNIGKSRPGDPATGREYGHGPSTGQWTSLRGQGDFMPWWLNLGDQR